MQILPDLYLADGFANARRQFITREDLRKRC